MKNLLLIMFVLSVLFFTNSANAFECPGVVRVPQTGNIVNLSEVDIQGNNNIIVVGSVECIYSYVSSKTYTQKTYTFNYTEDSYSASGTTNSNWNFGGNGLMECKSKNPADCSFENVNLPYVRQLQRCPDSVTDTYGNVGYFDYGINDSSYQYSIGTTKCLYDYSDFEVQGLYFDSDDHYDQTLWNSHSVPLSGILTCFGYGNGYSNNSKIPDLCEFYLAN